MTLRSSPNSIGGTAVGSAWPSPRGPRHQGQSVVAESLGYSASWAAHGVNQIAVRTMAVQHAHRARNGRAGHSRIVLIIVGESVWKVGEARSVAYWKCS